MNMALTKKYNILGEWRRGSKVGKQKEWLFKKMKSYTLGKI